MSLIEDKEMEKLLVKAVQHVYVVVLVLNTMIIPTIYGGEVEESLKVKRVHILAPGKILKVSKVLCILKLHPLENILKDGEAQKELEEKVVFLLS